MDYISLMVGSRYWIEHSIIFVLQPTLRGEGGTRINLKLILYINFRENSLRTALYIWAQRGLILLFGKEMTSDDVSSISYYSTNHVV